MMAVPAVFSMYVFGGIDIDNSNSALPSGTSKSANSAAAKKMPCDVAKFRATKMINSFLYFGASI